MKKNDRLPLRISEEEKKNWKEAAKKEGLTLSKWARRTLNEKSKAYK